MKRMDVFELRGSRSLVASAVSIALGSTFVPAALAAEPAELPRISVKDTEMPSGTEISSPKMTAAPVDTPQTISVIPQEVFNLQGAQNLTETLRNTPGITFTAGENGFSTGLSNFGLRGFDASGSIFIDGVRDSGNYNRDVFNVEQVEVAKGPAADNGRGGPGGYVNLVTKTPQADDFQRSTLSYGFDRYDSDDRVRATFDGNYSLRDGTALRVNALWQDGGVAGRDVAERNSWGIAPSLAFGLGSPTRVVLAYQHLDQSDLPDWGIPAAALEDTFRHDPNLDAGSLRERFYGLASDFDDVKSDAVLARIEHDFSPAVTLSNQIRWSQTERDAVYTVPFSYDAATQTVVTQTQAYARENSTLANLTNLSAAFVTGTLQHNLAVGLELTREKSDALRFGTVSNPGTGAPIGIFDPDPHRAEGPVMTPSQSSAVKIETVAAYVYDTVEFNERWQVTGGVRIERYDVEIDSNTADGQPQGPDAYDYGKTTVSGKLGLVYKPAEHGSVYASVGLSSLPPGSFLSNPDISREGDNAFPGFSAGLNSPDSKVQRSLNYEVGTKWEFFEQRLNASAALFRTVRENVAITGIDPRIDPPPPVARVGYGEQIVQGVELALSGEVTPAWSVFAGMVYLDSERKHSELLDQARRLANPNDYGSVLRTSGDELAFTPEFSGNVWTTYRLPFGLTVGGGLQYVGSSWVGRPDDAERIIPNGAFGKLPSYTVANLLVAYDVSEAVTVRLNVDNITDEVYAVSLNWPAQRALLGPSRSFLLSADVRF